MYGFIDDTAAQFSMRQPFVDSKFRVMENTNEVEKVYVPPTPIACLLI
jgi:hypothetical protein